LIKLKREIKDDSFESRIQNRLGKYIYQIFFGSHINRLWKYLRYGFLKKEDVDDYFAKRFGTACPVSRKGYLDHLDKALTYMADLGNVFSIGRQGLFSYTNIDHCMDMGLRVSKLIENGTLNKNKFLKIYVDYIG
jgi:hypothetical protein